MKNQTLRYITATIVGLASALIPVPGMLVAALIFPQGAEGDHGTIYLVLSLCLNFALFFSFTYLIFGRFSKTKIVD